MARRPPEAVVQVNLRIEEHLRQTLVQEAQRAGRSLNQEMMMRIMQTFRRTEADQILKQAEAVNEHTRRVYAETAKMLGVPVDTSLVAVPSKIGQISREPKKVGGAALPRMGQSSMVLSTKAKKESHTQTSAPARRAKEK